MNLFKTGVLTGVGLGLLAKEKFEETAKRMAEEAKLNDAETKEFVADLKKHADQTRAQLETLVQEQVEASIDHMGLARQKDLERLEEKLDALLQSRQATDSNSGTEGAQ